jgi:hypothetical protein
MMAVGKVSIEMSKTRDVNEKKRKERDSGCDEKESKIRFWSLSLCMSKLVQLFNKPKAKAWNRGRLKTKRKKHTAPKAARSLDRARLLIKSQKARVGERWS